MLTKKVNPEGFISKNDIDFEMFPIVFDTILNSKDYISPAINSGMEKILKQQICWDEWDAKFKPPPKGFQIKIYLNTSNSH